jgi:hypothetical protein
MQITEQVECKWVAKWRAISQQNWIIPNYGSAIIIAQP